MQFFLRKHAVQCLSCIMILIPPELAVLLIFPYSLLSTRASALDLIFSTPLSAELFADLSQCVCMVITKPKFRPGDVVDRYISDLDVACENLPVHSTIQLLMFA